MILEMSGNNGSNVVAIVAHNLEFGGAAIACKRLVSAFQQQGIKISIFSVKNKMSDENGVIIRKKNSYWPAILSRLDHLVCMILIRKNSQWASTGLFGSISANKINTIKPSFVNIHWIGHSTISLRQISKIKASIVITAHDEWWLNSIQHYQNENSDFTIPFMSRKILNSIEKKKQEVLNRSNVEIVCLSNEMANKFLNLLPSLKGRVKVIPNPVDSSIYHPLAKDIVGFESTTVLYLGGFVDKRKGYDLLLSALKKCKTKFQVIAPGFDGQFLTGKQNQIEVIGVPKITNERELNELYNTASITLVPSRQEALPQVATESLMAGTPVLSFQVGGLKDIILTGITGETVQNFSTLEFANKLDTFVTSSLKSKINPEVFALEKFSNAKVVDRYMDFHK